LFYHAKIRVARGVNGRFLHSVLPCPTMPALMTVLPTLAYFVLVFIVALVTALILTPLTIRLARRLQLFDQPGDRRLHAAPTPRLGGIPLTIAFLAALAVTLPFPRSDIQETPRVLGLCLGVIIIAIVGFLDDTRELKPLALFGMQFAAAAVAIA